MQTDKKCTKCNEVKPGSEFYRRPDTKRLRGQCKPCFIERTNSDYRRRFEENPEGFRAKWRAWNWKQRYGLTPKQYQQMVDEQGGKCGACGITPEYKLCVDHRHSDGKIRGLLCHNCNKALGLLRDSVDGVANYLEKTKCI